MMGMGILVWGTAGVCVRGVEVQGKAAGAGAGLEEAVRKG